MWRDPYGSAIWWNRMTAPFTPMQAYFPPLQSLTPGMAWYLVIYTLLIAEHYLSVICICKHINGIFCSLSAALSLSAPGTLLLNIQ